MNRQSPSMKQLLNDGKDVASLKELDAARFEEQVVNHLFSHYGLATSLRTKMRNEYKERFGNPLLTLTAFNEEFTDFPIHLFAAKIPKMRADCEFHRLAALFDKLKFAKLFQEMREGLPDGVETYGLVLHLPYVKRTGQQSLEQVSTSAVVLHNRTPQFYLPGGRFVHLLEEDGELLYLEKLSLLLDTIDAESTQGRWQPDG